MKDQEELDLEEETVGQGNPLDEKRKQIIEQAEKLQDESGEYVDVQDEDHDKTAEVVEDTPKVETEAVPQKKFKIKVNGQELELTESELIERAQKSEAADQKFQEAARLRQEAERLKVLPKGEPEKPAEPQVTDDDLALARALQMGDEVEAAKVVARLKTPPLTRDEVIRLTREQIEFNSSLNSFKESFPEIFKDQKLMTLAAQMDERLVKSGDTRSYTDRYKAIGEDIRKWTSTFTPASSQEKQERKASLTVVKTAGARATGPADEDKEESPSETIAKMAKSRGQLGGNI